MKKWICFFGAIYFFAPFFVFADGLQIKIISEPQQVLQNTESRVITLEVQDAGGIKYNVASTTHLSVSGSSVSGNFASSPADGPCATAWEHNLNLTVAKGTARKSFCYKDAVAGIYTITVSETDGFGITAGSQTINIISNASETLSTSTNASASSTAVSGTGENTTSTPELLTKSSYVSIYRFLPNPSGTDTGKEWVEIRNLDEKTVLLDGWLLDDKNTSNEPGSDAYSLSGRIEPGEIKRFTLPEEAFSLNNTGGDEVNLYFADKMLAEKAIYSALAYDDGIFEFRDGQWQPPAQSSSSASGGGSLSVNNSVSSNISGVPAVLFEINEVFPNPPGEDAGKEWVEIYNPENATSSLEGYFLQDGMGEAWTEASWQIPKNFLVSPKGLLAIILPKNSFALNNTGTEKIKLFSPGKKLLSSASFKDAEENKSFAKNADGGWEWEVPTPNLPNSTLFPKSLLFISEILPFPNPTAEEFVEIYNYSTSTINLENFVLQIGSKNKTFSSKDKIPAGEYYIIQEDDLPLRLNNAAGEVKLFDEYGRAAGEAVYSKAAQGMAFASLNGEKYSWTSEATPGRENLFVLGTNALAEKQKVSSQKKISTTVSSGADADFNQLLAMNTELQNKVAALQETLDKINEKLDAQSSLEKSVFSNNKSVQNGFLKDINWVRVFLYVGSFLFVAGGMYLTFRYYGR